MSTSRIGCAHELPEQSAEQCLLALWYIVASSENAVTTPWHCLRSIPSAVINLEQGSCLTHLVKLTFVRFRDGGDSV